MPPCAQAETGVAETTPAQWEGRLSAVRVETPTVRTFFFEAPPFSFGFVAGQYLALRIPGLTDPRGDSRTFSISSAPSDGRSVSVTTREGPSPFKRELFASRPGTNLELWGPFGNFVRDETRPAVLVGGGIGITPFRAMIREAAQRPSDQPLVLLYSSRTAEELVYREELEALERRSPDFRLFLSVTHATEGNQPWTGPSNRIDGDTVRRFARDLHAPVYYVCGPPKMVQELRRTLVREAGVAASDVRTELFQGY